MSNESLINRVLSACQSYEAGGLPLPEFASCVELNVGALEGLVESQRRELQSLATSLELAQFEYEDEDRINKAQAVATQLKDSLRAILRNTRAA